MPHSDDASLLLVPDFDDAFWRSEESRRFRDFPGFAKKKGHFEPDRHQSSASHWAAELVREDASLEIRLAYENTVAVLGNRRSAMERTETSLQCPQFRFSLEATQDAADPARVRLDRQLRILVPLFSLPPAFDQIFPCASEELVVPVSGQLDRRAVLRALEDWEHALRARLSEGADPGELRLRLPSGFNLKVDLNRRETVFSQDGVRGALALGAAVARELGAFGIHSRLK